MKRLLTAEDVAMVLELRSEGIKWVSIANYAFGMTHHRFMACDAHMGRGVINNNGETQ